MPRSLLIIGGLLVTAIIGYVLTSEVQPDPAEGSVDATKAVERCDGYRYGHNGYPKNHDQAFTWCEKAAVLGAPEGQSILAGMYFAGHGVKKSHRDALRWYTLAASREVAGASYALYWMYQLGMGTKRDKDTALMYLIQAARLDYELAKKVIAIPEDHPLVVAHTEEDIVAQLEEHGRAKFGPIYPKWAQKWGIEGWVIVEYCVDKEGRTLNPRVVNSDPELIFDEVSLAAAKGFRYTPEMVDGQPVERHGVQNKFTFELKK